MSICSTNNYVTLNTSISNLTDNILVGETDNQSVLRSVVLVLVLEGQSFSCIIVSDSLSPPLELNLEPLEVGLVLYNFNEPLKNKYSIDLNLRNQIIED